MDIVNHALAVHLQKQADGNQLRIVEVIYIRILDAGLLIRPPYRASHSSDPRAILRDRLDFHCVARRVAWMRADDGDIESRPSKRPAFLVKNAGIDRRMDGGQVNDSKAPRPVARIVRSRHCKGGIGEGLSETTGANISETIFAAE